MIKSLLFSATLMVQLACLSVPSTAQEKGTPHKEGRRLALVIAIGNYQEAGKLDGPYHDQIIVSAALKEVGFDVVDLRDVDVVALRQGIRNFARTVELSSPQLVLVWFSGHGIGVDGQTYFVPTDAKLRSAGELADETVPVDIAVNQISAANSTGLNLFFLDMDQYNPFASRSQRSGGLPKDGSAFSVKGGDNVIIMYATGAGATALDASPGEKGSPFAHAFAKAVTRPGLDLADIFRTVQFDVLQRTDGNQKPLMIGVAPKFYLIPPKAAQIHTRELADERIKRLGRVYVKTGEVEAPVYDASYALLIGVSNYDDPKSWSKLPGVISDLDALEDVLVNRHGFEVTKVVDPDDLEMERAYKQFIRIHGAKEGARLLIYYSGHGYSTDAGNYKIGWLVPRNAPHPVGTPEGFRVTAINMRRISEYSEIIRSKHVLWVFDSCFSGSLFDMAPSRAPLSVDAGLPRYWDQSIRSIITSGSAEEEVPDHSVFRELFVEALQGKHRVGRRDKLFTGYELGDFLKDNVYRYRERRQTPQNGVVPIRGLDRGSFIFQLGEEN